jgi:hypothetical protein
MSGDYQNKLEALKTAFCLGRDEYYNTYVEAKKNPSSESAQAAYNRAKNAVTTANSDLFVLENVVRGRINELTEKISSFDEKISEIKNTNQSLDEKSSKMQGTDKGAKVRFVNSRQASYTLLYKTIAITIISFYTISKLRGQVAPQ